MPHVRKSKLIEQRLEAHAAFIEAEPRRLAGSWRGRLGNPAAKLHVDLGCGKGLWLSRAAKTTPDAVFLGIDNERMCASFAVEALAQAQAGNARVVLDEASNLEALFALGEVDVIHINFPTPFPRKKEAHKRVTAAERLMEYRRILGAEGVIHLKTDSQPLFDFTLEELERAGYRIVAFTRDLHGAGSRGDAPVRAGGANDEPDAGAPSAPGATPAAGLSAGASATFAAETAAVSPRLATDDFGEFSPHDYTLSAYEEKLTAKGARVMALHAVAGAQPACFSPGQPTGLAHYLPSDLESIDYIPHGMEDTVNNMRNRKRNAELRAARRAERTSRS